MAMIRVELERERRRLPVVLGVAAVGLVLIGAYGVDRHVGLLRLLHLHSAAGTVTTRPPVATQAAEDEPIGAAPVDELTQTAARPVDPDPADRSPDRSPADPDDGVIAVVKTVTPGGAVREPLATSGAAGARASAAEREQVATREQERVAALAASTAQVTWWHTAQRLARRLPPSSIVTATSCGADGTFRLTGVIADHNRGAQDLADAVATMRHQGLHAELTLWRDGSAPDSRFLVSGRAGSDAPTAPPVTESLEPDALAQLARQHAVTLGLYGSSLLRPKHEPWAHDMTRVEGGVSAVGSDEQITAFGRALAAEPTARLTQFTLETTAGGMTRVTASLDVLLGRESSP